MKLTEVLDIMIKKYEEEYQGAIKQASNPQEKMQALIKLTMLKACKSNLEKGDA